MVPKLTFFNQSYHDVIIIDKFRILQCSARELGLRYLLAGHRTDPVLHFKNHLINLHLRMLEMVELHAKSILHTLRFSLICA